MCKSLRFHDHTSLKRIDSVIISYVIFTLESSTFIRIHVCNLSFDVPDWYVFIYRRTFFRFFTRNQCIFHGVICMVKCVIWIKIISGFYIFAIILINWAYVLFRFHIKKKSPPCIRQFNWYSSGRFSTWYAYYQ